MSRREIFLGTAATESLRQLGKNIRHKRVLFRMSQKMLCSRADVARSTLQDIEAGNPRVAIGNYAKVLEALSVPDHFKRVASYDDTWARQLAKELMGWKRVRFANMNVADKPD